MGGELGTDAEPTTQGISTRARTLSVQIGIPLPQSGHCDLFSPAALFERTLSSILLPATAYQIPEGISRQDGQGTAPYCPPATSPGTTSGPWEGEREKLDSG
jgi:hypothetical protein